MLLQLCRTIAVLYIQLYIPFLLRLLLLLLFLLPRLLLMILLSLIHIFILSFFILYYSCLSYQSSLYPLLLSSWLLLLPCCCERVRLLGLVSFILPNGNVQTSKHQFLLVEYQPMNFYDLVCFISTCKAASSPSTGHYLWKKQLEARPQTPWIDTSNMQFSKWFQGIFRNACSENDVALEVLKNWYDMFMHFFSTQGYSNFEAFCTTFLSYQRSASKITIIPWVSPTLKWLRTCLGFWRSPWGHCDIGKKSPTKQGRFWNR